MDFAEEKSDGKARQNLFNRGEKRLCKQKWGAGRGRGDVKRHKTARAEKVPGESREEPGARPWKCSRSLRQEPRRDSPRETAGSSERETDVQGQLRLMFRDN